MKQSDPLQLVGPGSLVRPGPIGRIVRLAMGVACLYAMYQIVLNGWSIVMNPVSVFVRFTDQGSVAVQTDLVMASLVALFILNYVVNIGFGKSWGRWPSYLSIGVMLILAAAGWLFAGSPDHPTLGFALWTWLTYFYTHLGLSFVLSAVIATPGCEMRSIPELYGRLTGKASAEHVCPASFITKLDEWERTRLSRA